jgi:hypothetical protein
MKVEEQEKVLEKIKKLFALGESPNQHEAELALARAQELLVKYNLDAGLMEKPDKEELWLFGDPGYSTKIPDWKVYLASILSKHFMVWLINTKNVNDKGTKLVKNHYIIGNPANVQMFSYSVQFLLRSYDSLCKGFMKKYLAEQRANGFQPNQRTRKVSRESFYMGLNNGFNETLTAQQKKNTEKGLVLVRPDLPPFEGFQVGRSKKRGRKYDPMAAARGKEEGKKLKIRTGVGTDQTGGSKVLALGGS